MALLRSGSRISTELSGDDFTASSSGVRLSEFDRLQYKAWTLRGGTASTQVGNAGLLGYRRAQPPVRLSEPSSLVPDNDRKSPSKSPGSASASQGIQSFGSGRFSGFGIQSRSDWWMSSNSRPSVSSGCDDPFIEEDSCSSSSSRPSIQEVSKNTKDSSPGEKEPEAEAFAEEAKQQDDESPSGNTGRRQRKVSIRTDGDEAGSSPRGQDSDRPSLRDRRVSCLSRASTFSRSALKERQTNLADALEAFQKYRSEAHGGEEHKTCVIHPDRPLRLTWDLVALSAITYQALTVPYELAFLTGTPVAELCLYRTFTFASAGEDCFFAMVSLLVDIFFFFDIIMNFMTGFYDKGTLILSKHRCAWHYTKTWLAVDLLGIFPWRLVSPAESPGGATNLLRMLKFLKFIRLLKLLRVMKLRSTLIKLEDHLKSQYLYLIFQVIKLSLSLLLLCHITACAWYGIGRLTLSNDEHHTSWIQEAGLPTGACEGECYGAALYFTMATMTTVGYGDIRAGTSPLERGFATLMLLAGTGVFAMLVSSIASLFQGSQSSASAYATAAERNRAALRYLWNTGAGGALTVEIRKYLEQKERLKEDVIMETHLRDNLSLSLLHDLCVENFRPSIVKFEFFKEMTSSVIDEICTICSSARFCPGEVVCVEGDEADAMFFIKKGRVLVFRHGTGLACPPMGEGMYLGEACFFTTVAYRQATVICETFCELVQLDKANLKELCKWQDELRKSMKLRMRRVSIHSQLLASTGKLAESQDHLRLASVCSLCKVQGHYPHECPTKRLFDDPETHLIIGRSAPELKSWCDRCSEMGRMVLPGSFSDKFLANVRPRRRIQIMGVWAEDENEEMQNPRTHNLKCLRRSISEIAANCEWSDSEEDESEEYEDNTASAANTAGAAAGTEGKASEGVYKPLGDTSRSILSQPGTFKKDLGTAASEGSPKNTKKARILLVESTGMDKAYSEQIGAKEDDAGDGDRLRQHVSIH